MKTLASKERESLERKREMKFGKRLKRQIEETLPEWRDKFLSYKDLKQLLRLIAGGGRQSSGEEFEVEFRRLLDAEIEKLNSFFVEQEEDFIIRQKASRISPAIPYQFRNLIRLRLFEIGDSVSLQEIQERIQHAIVTWGPNGIRPSELRYADEMRRIRRDVVDFHGEMVLLENYSSINYTGLAKILKKYDKRNGALLRLPFIEKILEQPFFTTDLVSKLVKECESTMDSVFPVPMEQQRSSEERDSTVTASEQSIYRNTVAALVTMHELRRGSSTYSHFSLPPMEADLLQSLHLPSPIPIL